MKKTFRIVIPTKVDEFFTLFDNVLTKHQNDGAGSVLQILNMADAESKFTIARNAHDEAEQMSKNVEKAIQKRNVALGLNYDQQSYLQGSILFFIISIRDILLGHLLGEEPKMGQWGYEVSMNKKGKYKTYIPYRKPLVLISLAQKIIDKHLNDGASSPLSTLNMVLFAQLLNTAKQEQKNAEDFKNNRDIAYKIRNNAMGWGKNQNSSMVGTLKFYIRAIRNTLLGKYRGFEQTLGDWGFEVNSSLKG